MSTHTFPSLNQGHSPATPGLVVQGPPAAWWAIFRSMENMMWDTVAIHPSMTACLPRVSGVGEPTHHFQTYYLIRIGTRRQLLKRGCNGMVSLNICGDYEAEPVLTSGTQILGVLGLVFYCNILQYSSTMKSSWSSRSMTQSVIRPQNRTELNIVTFNPGQTAFSVTVIAKVALLLLLDLLFTVQL